MNHARHRYHQLMEEYFQLLPEVSLSDVMANFKDKKPSFQYAIYKTLKDHRERRLYWLSYHIPLTDHQATELEWKEYVHKNTRHFPVVSKRKQLVREIERLTG